MNFEEEEKYFENKKVFSDYDMTICVIAFFGKPNHN